MRRDREWRRSKAQTKLCRIRDRLARLYKPDLLFMLQHGFDGEQHYSRTYFKKNSSTETIEVVL